MMTSGELMILDVGHGNCAIIRHGTEAIIIDAPGRSVLGKALNELGITSIHALLISHADNDHLVGAVSILASLTRPVKHVYVNPDNRDSKGWISFRRAAGLARKRGTSIHTTLNMEDPGSVSLLGTKLQVLYPTPEMCLATNNGVHIDGNKIDPNSMSAVVLVEHDGENICLLAADSGHQSLETMIDEKVKLTAEMLIFPHHGGNVAGTSDNNLFAKRLVTAVKPKVVIFSIGRGRHGTPRPEIVAGVREALFDSPPYIACTQLSANCIDVVPNVPRVLNKQSGGIKRKVCCAGTVSWTLEKNGLAGIVKDLNENHSDFVSREIPGALCRRKVIPIAIKITP